MFNPETDFIFPARVLPDLKALRGPAWQELVERAASAEACAPERLGFMLMMVRLNGCQRCNADSFKAMRGCSACSQQTIERFSGEDGDLKEQFADAVAEVSEYLQAPDPVGAD